MNLPIKLDKNDCIDAQLSSPPAILSKTSTIKISPAKRTAPVPLCKIDNFAVKGSLYICRCGDIGRGSFHAMLIPDVYILKYDFKGFYCNKIMLKFNHEHYITNRFVSITLLTLTRVLIIYNNLMSTFDVFISLHFINTTDCSIKLKRETLTFV